jgi:hypothetical protein
VEIQSLLLHEQGQKFSIGNSIYMDLYVCQNLQKFIAERVEFNVCKFSI